MTNVVTMYPKNAFDHLFDTLIDLERNHTTIKPALVQKTAVRVLQDKSFKKDYSRYCSNKFNNNNEYCLEHQDCISLDEKSIVTLYSEDQHFRFLEAYNFDTNEKFIVIPTEAEFVIDRASLFSDYTNPIAHEKLSYFPTHDDKTARENYGTLYNNAKQQHMKQNFSQTLFKGFKNIFKPGSK